MQKKTLQQLFDFAVEKYVSIRVNGQPTRQERSITALMRRYRASLIKRGYTPEEAMQGLRDLQQAGELEFNSED